jgi:hypothetical protein
MFAVLLKKKKNYSIVLPIIKSDQTKHLLSNMVTTKEQFDWA